MPAPGFRCPEMLMCFRPMQLVVLGLGVGWGAYKTAPPVIVLESLDALADALANVFFSASGLLLHSGFLPSIFKLGGCCQHSWSLVGCFSWCP